MISEEDTKLMEEVQQLTDEQIHEIAKTVEEEYVDSRTDKAMKKAAEEATKTPQQKLEEATVKMVSNPITGKPIMVEEDNLDNDEWVNSGPDTLEELLADDSIQVDEIDPDKIIIRDETVKTITSTMFSEAKLNIADVTMIINACDRVKRKEIFSYYNAMPTVIQNQIKTMIGVGMGNKMGSFTREGKNFIAKSLIDDIINNEFMEFANSDLQNTIANLTAKTREEMKKDDFWSSRRKFFFEYLPKKEEEYSANGDIEKADLASEMRDSFVNSYQFKDMMDLYSTTGKLRIKKIQLEKFERTCNEFNLKYERSKNNIHDIKGLLNPLRRVTEGKYSDDILKEFVCVFIAYSNFKHLDPNNLLDHVFMYYFISNIITIDYYNPDKEDDVQFRTQLINNINEFLKLIEEKR